VDEVYISTDVETDGPIPGPNSMLSLGAAAFSSQGLLLGTFTVNLVTLEGATPDPDTEAWWRTQPKAIYDACRSDPKPPDVAMREYTEWVKSFKHRPVFVGYPAGFDFLFCYWYLKRFTGDSPFSFSALDVKTFAMAEMGCGYRDTSKSSMPKRWFKGLPKHTHRAIDDAIEQGYLFMNILRENRARPR
jgi:DNA polymerase III alpha subunit (gram-positive type)